MRGSLDVADLCEPYAQAMMAVAKDRNLTERFGEDAAFARSLLRTSDDLQAFLENPIVTDDDKKAVLQKLTGDRVDDTFANFLRLLVDRKRIAFLDGILRRYQALLRELTRTVLAEVTAASDLSDEQRQAIDQRVKVFTGAERVELDVQVDPDLIAGVIVRVGSQVIDSSLRGQLRRIAFSLSAS